MSPEIILATAAILTFFVVGYVLGEASRMKTPDPETIEKYLKKNLPNEWAAYKKGVDEGYLQGLRDGQGDFQ